MNSTYLRSIPGLKAELTVQTGHRVLGPVAYASDLGWEVVVHNDAFPDLFDGGVPPTNILKWIADEGKDQLPEADRWRGAALAQLRQQLAKHPGDPRLLTLKQWCLTTPGVAEAWAALSGSSEAATTPDGEIRPLIHPLYGPGSIEIGLLAPHRHRSRDELRVCMMDFHIGVTPEQLLQERQSGVPLP